MFTTLRSEMIQVAARNGPPRHSIDSSG